MATNHLHAEPHTPPQHQPWHQQDQFPLSGTIALCWVIQGILCLAELPGLPMAQPRASGKRNKITTVAGKIFPQIPFRSKTSAHSAWGRARPMDRAGPHAPTCPRQQLSGEEEEEEALSHTSTKAAQDCPGTKTSLGHQPSEGNTTLPFHSLSSLLAWPCSGFLSMPNAVFALFCQKASWHPVATPAAPAAVTHKLCPNLKAPACLLR